MGNNSVLLICNDAIHEIENDAEGWWRKAWQKLCTIGRVPMSFGHGNHVNGFQAVWNRHADEIGVIIVGGNYATIVGTSRLSNCAHHTEEGQLAIFKEIMEKRGYYVSKKHGTKKT